MEPPQQGTTWATDIPFSDPQRAIDNAGQRNDRRPGKGNWFLGRLGRSSPPDVRPPAQGLAVQKPADASGADLSVEHQESQQPQAPAHIPARNVEVKLGQFLAQPQDVEQRQVQQYQNSRPGQVHEQERYSPALPEQPHGLGQYRPPMGQPYDPYASQQAQMPYGELPGTQHQQAEPGQQPPSEQQIQQQQSGQLKSRQRSPPQQQLLPQSFPQQPLQQTPSEQQTQQQQSGQLKPRQRSPPQQQPLPQPFPQQPLQQVAENYDHRPVESDSFPVHQSPPVLQFPRSQGVHLPPTPPVYNSGRVDEYPKQEHRRSFPERDSPPTIQPFQRSEVVQFPPTPPVPTLGLAVKPADEDGWHHVDGANTNGLGIGISNDLGRPGPKNQIYGTKEVSAEERPGLVQARPPQQEQQKQSSDNNLASKPKQNSVISFPPRPSPKLDQPTPESQHRLSESASPEPNADYPYRPPDIQPTRRNMSVVSLTKAPTPKEIASEHAHAADPPLVQYIPQTNGENERAEKSFSVLSRGVTKEQVPEKEKALKRELEEAHQTIYHLRTESEQLVQSHTRMQKLLQEAQQPADEKLVQEKARHADTKRRLEDINKEAHRLHEEMADKDEDLEEAKGENARKNEEIKQLNARVAAADEEAKRLRSEAERKDEEAKQLTALVANLHKEAEIFNETRHHLEIEIQRLTRQLSSQALEADQRARQIAEKEDLLSRANEMFKRMKFDFERKDDEVKKLTAGIDVIKSTLANL